MTEPRRYRWRWGAGALLLIVAVIGWRRHTSTPEGGMGHSQTQSRSTTPVAIATARAADFPVWLTGLGTVTPVYTVTMKTLVNGELMQVHYKEGQLVRKGDLLAQVDPRPFEVQLEQAEGQLARDQALLDNAKLDLSRYQTLIKTGAVPQQQLDTQVALVAQDQGVVLTDKGQVDNARLQLVYSRITAPIDGRVGLRLVDPGNNVQTSDTTGMVVITQESPITVIFPLPQDDLDQILTGMRQAKPLPVEVWDRSNQRKLADGVLETLDNQVDVTTGMIKLRAAFSNGHHELFPNQFVNARVRVAVLSNAVVIPSAGIQQGNQGPYAFVVDDRHRVSVRLIKPGPADGDSSAILSGLSAGERVVTDGVDNLREGMTVEEARRGPT